VKVMVVLLSIAAALALQTTLVRFTVGDRTGLDLVLVLVVFVALTAGPVGGLLTGSAAGLAQDALSGAIVGVGGLAKTIVGFVTGVLGSQFIVQHAMLRFLVFFGATLLHETCFRLVNFVLEPGGFVWSWPAVLLRATANSVVGIVAFQVAEGLPAALQRRRAGGAITSRRY